jgi:DNA-nicking Smr family endonuclease
MAKLKKHKKRSSDFQAADNNSNPAAVADQNPINRPFAGLASLRDSLLAQKRRDEAKNQKRSKNAPVQPSNPATPEVKIAKEPEPTDDLFFRMAMSDVQPLPQGKLRNQASPKPANQWKTPGQEVEDNEVVKVLTDLVSGNGEFDLRYTDEYVEGQAKGFPAAIMDRLRQGLIPTQAHLDLHGLTLNEAEEAIGQFIARSLDLGRNCVLLIHGRGHRSPGGVPVIKRNLENLLLHRGVKHHILAFTTAKPIDGGLGASYIFLRNN